MRSTQSRRDFLTTRRQRPRPAGAGVAAAATTACSPPSAAATGGRVNPLAPQAAALRAEGQDLHLHLPGRRAQPARPVRPQAEAQRAARPAAARVADQERPLRLPPEGHRHAPGQPAQVHASTASAAWSCPTCCRTSAPCADDICLIRSMHTDAFNHHPGQLLMNCGRAMLRPAEHGLVAHLRPGQRVAEPARLRRAHRRPRHQRRRLATGRAASCPRPTPGVLFRNQGEPVLNLQQPAGPARRDAARRRSTRCAT